MTVLLFALVSTWNNYFLPLLMLDSAELFPLPAGLAQWRATAAGGSGAQALFSTVITGSLLSIIRWSSPSSSCSGTGSPWTPLGGRCCSAPTAQHDCETVPLPAWRYLLAQYVVKRGER